MPARRRQEPSRVVALELAVQDLAGLRVAADVGARRVELCAGLGPTGGLTPGAGLVEAVLAAARGSSRPGVGPEVHVLVRPRPGGFVYTPDEIEVQVREVRSAVAAGAHGVVVGALTASGQVDADAVRGFVDAADGAQVTFHRAVDVVPDPFGALDVLALLGVTRVLTSGGAPRSVDRVERLRELTAHAHGRTGGGTEIMAGGGVRPQDVATLVAAGVDAVHLSAKRLVPDHAGPGGGGDAGYEVTDPSVAAAARESLDAACGAA